MSEAFRRIREVRKRRDPNERATAPAYNGDRDLGDLEQRRHGITDAAIAAWDEVRLSFKEVGVAAVGGVTDYVLEVYMGERWVVEPAVYVEDRNGRRIYLTGCSWGYGGEGPHGTATILADLGLHPTVEDALRFVSRLDINRVWEVRIP